jgi:hypothetical protein
MNPVMAAPASLPVQAGLFSFPHPAVNHCHPTYSRRINQIGIKNVSHVSSWIGSRLDQTGHPSSAW